MPWAETSPMEERARFVVECQSGLYSTTELCERFGISRKTGYKWMHRYQAQGFEGLRDRSRAPRHCPHRMPEPVAAAIVEARRRHPYWGPKKLVAWLGRQRPEWSWPAPSSAGALLARHGLVKPRKRRRRAPHPGRPCVQAQQPNDLWTADFKGEFRTGDHCYCFPLTIADHCSRYLLEVRGLDSTAAAGSRVVFERTFREVGLPRVIQTDNGSPFVSQGIHGLTRLSVWWIRLGITPVRIEVSSPHQNGAHERMHRTLKEETARPPAAHRRAQQQRFDRFRQRYNEERPHESLGQRPPATVWQPSPRTFPTELPELEYPGHFETRLVSQVGQFSFRSRAVFLGSALFDQRVGLEEVDDGIWSVYLGPVLLGRLDERIMVIQP